MRPTARPAPAAPTPSQHAPPRRQRRRAAARAQARRGHRARVRRHASPFTAVCNPAQRRARETAAAAAAAAPAGHAPATQAARFRRAERCTHLIELQSRSEARRRHLLLCLHVIHLARRLLVRLRSLHLAQFALRRRCTRLRLGHASCVAVRAGVRPVRLAVVAVRHRSGERATRANGTTRRRRAGPPRRQCCALLRRPCACAAASRPRLLGARGHRPRPSGAGLAARRVGCDPPPCGCVLAPSCSMATRRCATPIWAAAARSPGSRRQRAGDTRGSERVACAL